MTQCRITISCRGSNWLDPKAMNVHHGNTLFIHSSAQQSKCFKAKGYKQSDRYWISVNIIGHSKSVDTYKKENGSWCHVINTSNLWCQGKTWRHYKTSKFFINQITSGWVFGELYQRTLAYVSHTMKSIYFTFCIFFSINYLIPTRTYAVRWGMWCPFAKT